MKTCTDVSVNQRVLERVIPYQEEPPIDICESMVCHLQIDKIGQSKNQVYQRHAVRSNVVQEYLTVKDIAANINNKLVDGVEAEQCCYTQCTDVLFGWTHLEVAYRDSFDDVTDAATANTNQHNRATSDDL
jgi:hypothetical protein